MGFVGFPPCSHHRNHVPVKLVGENVWEIEFYRKTCRPPFNVDGGLKMGFNGVLGGMMGVENGVWKIFTVSPIF